VVLWAPFVAYLGLTYYFSSRTNVPGASLVPDYVLHTIEFSALAGLLLRAISGGVLNAHSTRALAGTFVFGVVYGIIDEFHQSFVPGRESSVRDASVDAAATAATVLVLGWFTGARGWGNRSGPLRPRKGTGGGAESAPRGSTLARHRHSAPKLALDRDSERARVAAGASSQSPAEQAAVEGGEAGPESAVRGPAPEARVELLTREGCHLCEEAESVLAEALGPPGRLWRVTDIDSDAALLERYGREIPVVFVDGIRRFKVRVDRERLTRLLSEPARYRQGATSFRRRLV